MTTTALEIFGALDSPAGRADPYPHYAALHELGEASLATTMTSEFNL